jgi:hypothetical protein
MSEKIVRNNLLSISLTGKRQAALFLLNILLVAILTALGPLERTLGANIRVVYLHGAWVWTAKLIFGLAAVAGLVSLVLPKVRQRWEEWSLALGRTGLIFWLIYLPLALVVMQVNWGGFFFDEPRWRVSLMFGIVGTLLQAALYLVNTPWITSMANLLFGGALWVMIDTAATEMHPVSPIFGSDALGIQVYFVALLVLVLLLGVQVAIWIRGVIVKHAPSDSLIHTR